MIVIDTHVLIWWVSGSDQLSVKAGAAIDAELASSKGKIFVSSISAWEIAMLVSKDRLQLSMNVDSWIEIVKGIETVQFVPLDNKVAIESTRLPGEFHKDPADRMIVSLARSLSLPLVTADEKILNYAHVKTLW